MKSMLALSCMVLGFAAAPAFAQTSTTTTPPATTAMSPTKEQCTAGYKSDFEKSMKMTKAQFDSACAKLTNPK